MKEPQNFFVAAQLASVLGVSRVRAHQHMAGIKPKVLTLPGRGKVFCWPVSAIPGSLYGELQAVAHRRGFCSIVHLLSAPPEPWEPRHPLERLTEDAKQKATARQRVLKDILAADGAQLLSTSALVERALPGFQSCPVVLNVSARSVRRWIENALERDRGALRWERVEIYLDEGAPLKAPVTEASEKVQSVGGNRLAELVSPLKGQSSITAERQAVIWDAVFCEWEAQTGKGVSERAAKAKLLHILQEHIPSIVPAKASARSMQWQRQLDRWREGGRNMDAFVDNRSHAAGRKASGYVTDEETKAIREITKKVPGFHRVTALFQYAKSAKCTRPELREIILRHRKSKHNMPEWLMRAATLSPTEQLRQHGPRRYQLHGFTVKRNGLEAMEDGSERIIEAGDWWLFDDMSQNTPFWFENVMGDADDELARKQKVSICRQSLMAMDLRSGRWLGCELVGRSRDSYRAEDILRFFFRLFKLYGTPRRGVILENGIWRCKVIAGEQTKEVTLSEEEKEKVIGGLRALGIEVRHAINAKGKALIESAFRHYQNLVSAMVDALNIGRGRGDRERDAAKFQRARAGIVHPSEVNMLHIDKLNTEMARVMAFFNAERKEGDIQNGVPDEVWNQSLAAASLRAMPMEKLHVLMPAQRELKIRGGHVWPTVNGRTLGFINPEQFAILGDGYRLRVHFDASEPSLGAWVFNAETSTLNTEGHKVGQFLCRAEHAEEAPQVAYPGYTDDNIRHKKAYNGAVRIAFCTPAGDGQEAVSAREARDGRGNVVRIEQGANSGLRDVAPLSLGKRRRGGSPRADELAEKARADKAARKPKIAEVDVDVLQAKIRRQEDVLIADGLGYRESDGSLHLF